MTPSEQARADVLEPCNHERADLDTPGYEYCEDCGAVRRRTKPGRPPEQWHTCPKCDLRIVPTQPCLPSRP